MKTPPARDMSEAEAPFRAPESLALAMPLIAVVGLVVVVSAVALGASGPIVALLAVVGFGLCALAPMALIETFVNRPLRGALAQLRAARDGRGAPNAAFASGVLSDLVHVARDLHAAQSNLGPAALSPFETLVAASEEAARGLRDQAESVAEAAADGESQINRAAQACFADIAQAIKSLRDAPVNSGFDGAVERLEAMLVYIAETQERAEAKDRQFEGAFERVEVGMADVARLVTRETETAQGAASSVALTVRGGIADALAQEKSGRTRVLERLDTLEARLMKGADGVSAEVVRLGEAIRPALTPVGGKLDALAVALTRVEAGRTAPAAEIGDELRALGASVTRLAEDFAAREPVEAALRGVSEMLAAGFQEANIAGLRAELGALAGRIETLRAPEGADLSRQIADIAARLDNLGRADWAGELAAARGGINALGARMDENLSALGRTTQDAVRGLSDAVTNSPEAWEKLGAEMQSVARAVETLDIAVLSRGLEAVQARLAAHGEGAKALAETVENALTEVAARTESAAQRHRERLDDFAEETLDPARQAMLGAAKDLITLRARFEAGDPALARAVEATQGVRARLDALAESLPRAFAETAETQVERLAARFDAAALAPVPDTLARAVESLETAHVRLGEAIVRIEAGDPRLASVAGKTEAMRNQIEGLAQAMRAQGDRASGVDAEALAQAAERFDAAQGRLAAAVEKLEAGDPRVLAGADLRDQIGGLFESRIAALGETMRAQGDALASRLDAGSLAPAREALAQASESFAAAQARLAVAAEKIEAGDPRFDALAETMREQSHELAARLDAAALTPARDALSEATRSFGAAQTQLTDALVRIGAGDVSLSEIASATGKLQSGVAGLAETMQAHAAKLAERLDAAALTPAREALAQATQSFGAAQAQLTQALGRIEADDSRAAGDLQVRIGDLAEAMRTQGDALAARLDAAALTPAREALAQATQSFGAAQAQLTEALGRIESDDSHAAGELQSRIGDLAEAMRTQGDAFAARFDAAALTPAREALAQATQSFGAAQAQLTEALGRIEADDSRAAGDLQVRIGDLAEGMRTQGDAFAARLDAAALTPAREALAQATQSFGAAQAKLTEALGRMEAGDSDAAGELQSRISDLAARLDVSATPLREALAQATQDFGAAQAHLTEVAGRIEAGDARAAGKLHVRIGDLVEAVRSQNDDFAARIDAAALTPARDAFAQATQSFAVAQTRLTQAAAKVEAGDPELARVADATRILRADFAALAQNLPNALSDHASALLPARDALTDATRAFDAARSRLDDGAESLARLRGDFVASEARFARMLEESVARMAALGFERLPDLVNELSAAQAQWRGRLSEFDRSASALAGLADADTHALAALRDAIGSAERTLHGAIVEMAPRLETAAAAQADRLVAALETRDRAGALELGAAISALAEIQARPAPAPISLDALRADLAASGEAVAGRFDDAAQALARRIEERVESLRRGEFAPAAAALQAATNDLGKAQAELFAQADAFKASLAGDRSALAAMRQDIVLTHAAVSAVGERTDASLRGAAERADALAADVNRLAGAERAELTALAQALGRIGERVEYAARAFEERRGGDLATLGADLTRDIDALARATAERVLALEGGVETLAHAAGATLSQVREATRALNGAGLDKIVSRLDPLAELPALTRDLREILAHAPAGGDWRPALDALGARLAEMLGAVERRLQAQIRTAGPAVSMADLPFSQIEAGLADLNARLSGETGVSAAPLNAASRALQSSFSEFGDVSAALVESVEPEASHAPNSALQTG